MKYKRLFLILSVLFLIFQVLDLYTTYTAIKLSGSDAEQNPFMKKAYDAKGMLGMIMFKILGVGFLVCVYCFVSFKTRLASLFLVNILYLWVVLHNFSVIV